MFVIRWLLGRIIFLVDSLFRPRQYKHLSELQTHYDQDAKSLTLYQYAACPFCVKVRWAMRRAGINVALKDAKRNPQYAQELVEGGGLLKVPCLRIEDSAEKVQWLYESSDIIAYLQQRFPGQVEKA